jgi:adenosine deaminase
LAALREGGKERIRRVPKTDFHNHSILGTRLKSVEKWIGLSLPKPPARMKSLQAMKEYAEQILCPHIYSREGFEFTADSALQDAIYDGVVVLEMSLDSKFIDMYPDRENGFISFLSRLKRKYQQKINFRPELGISRDRNFREIEGVLTRCIESSFFMPWIFTDMKEHRHRKLKKFFIKRQDKRG